MVPGGIFTTGGAMPPSDVPASGAPSAAQRSAMRDTPRPSVSSSETYSSLLGLG